MITAVTAAIGVTLSCGSPDASAAKEIIHDGEYKFVEAQHGKVGQRRC